MRQGSRVLPALPCLPETVSHLSVKKVIMMRLFIALDLSPSLCASLTGVQDAFRRAGIHGNYSPAENLHLTLAFIGEVPSPDPVVEALQTVSFTPFPLELQGVGAFRDSWWGAVRESAPLHALVRRIRRALQHAGIPFDNKSFRPHITLVRRPVAPGKAPAILPPAEPRPASMRVEQFVLYRSDPGKKHMVYTPLAVFDADEAASWPEE